MKNVLYAASKRLDSAEYRCIAVARAWAKRFAILKGQAAALLRSQCVTQLGQRRVALAHENG
jgi:hypothetical protein